MKIIRTILLFSAMLCMAAGMTVTAFAADSAPTVPSADDWDLQRATVENTADGVLIRQTEMGTPDNHAIAILEVPFNDVENFEITLRISMEEYVASGYAANDVWAGIGFMGKPTFINWRNSEEHGWAKDSPGFFMRLMNYSGDLGWSLDVYQENYHTLGEESKPSDIVDTWHLGEGNADCNIGQDVTIALKFDEYETGIRYYRLFINGENITQNKEASHAEKDVIFADGKLYLLLVMNTQEDEMNSLSRITVKSVNGVSYATRSGNEQGGDTAKKSGCKGSIAGTSAMAAAAVLLCAAAVLACVKTEKRAK